MRGCGSVAEVRVAVRRSIAGLPPGSLVLAACSGGPDSLALAAALAFLAPRRALRGGLLTVDHGWYEGSAARADTVAAQGRELGLDPVEVLTAHSRRSEGAARDARRSALTRAAERLGASAVLLGHTLDDQAETVLLRLARGSGARTLAGMPHSDGLFRRPLLEIRRSATRSACLADGLTPWDDPTNADEAFARARVRHRVLPMLEDALGPGIAEALARTADLLRADSEALDADTAVVYDQLVLPSSAPVRIDLDLAGLAALSAALRGRVMRRAALALGSAPAGLRADHIRAMDELVTRWRGQKPVPLPSGVIATRTNSRISVSQAAGSETSAFQAPAARTSGSDAAGQGDRCRQPVPATARPRTWPGIPTAHAADGGEPHGNTRETQVITNAHTVPHRAGPDGTGTGDRPPASPHPDIDEILVSTSEIASKLRELAALVDADYAGREVLLVGVLKGAVMVMADLSRLLTIPLTMEFMAVSSYGSATSSSGVVRILKDLDQPIEGKDVLVVEDIIDSGLTLSWLLRYLRSRGPASVEVLALLRKPEALAVDIDVRYVGFDIPSAFVVGYGLDYAESYRTLPYVGTLTQEAIERGAR
ncbi:hypoxanthine phosphoribosyltransferase [Frankia sp. CiP3]|uniref:hypoxanthine phosphoribosyltransferase n=1 Tax=Frankia sp. CiP3 TaxID=2880971 RepID=UPI001EF44454|nr:hypoxanthine phosphoribosyltransferase [Frankia sp. CiP3]